MADLIPQPRRRRWWKIALGAALVVLLAIAAFPWALATPPGRRWLLARANRALAPGRLDFADIRFSWIGPTRLTRFVLIDARGDRVIDAPSARWDRTLWQALFDQPRFGTLRLDRAALDIERRADGTVNLYETLKPILRYDPERDLTIIVDRGRLRFRSAGVPVPVSADTADLLLKFPPAPHPLTWRVHLVNDGESLEVLGQYDRWKSPPEVPGDLSIAVKGNRWPWSLETMGLVAHGRLQGDFAFQRVTQRWTTSGAADITDLSLTGPRLNGDQLLLDRVKSAWDLAQAADGWAIRRLNLTSPIGSLQTEGTLPARPGSAGRIDGSIDLAALAQQLPHALRLREGISVERGRAMVRLDSSVDSGSRQWQLEAKVSDLSAVDHGRAFTLREPATLHAQAEQSDREFNVKEVGLETAFLTAKGHGDLDQGFAWSGTLDLAGFQRQFRELIDFGRLDIEGKGQITGDYKRTGARFEARTTADLKGLKVSGLAPSTVVRETVHLTASLRGAADTSGLPGSWDESQVDLHSGSVEATLAASQRDKAVGFRASARGSLVLAGRDQQVRALIEGNWADPRATIERLEAVLSPERKDPSAKPIRLLARAAFDRAKGEFSLTPVRVKDPAAGITLEGEGLHISGIGRPGALRAEGSLVGRNADLVGLVAPGRDDIGGTWTLRTSARSVAEGVQVAARLDLRDLSNAARGGEVPPERESISLATKVLLRSDSDQLDLAELVVATPYATADASGHVSELSGRRVVDLRGTLRPDWTAINELLASRVEPGARLSGKPRALRIKGPLDGDSSGGWPKGLEAELGFDMTGADVYGMQIGATPVVVRGRDGRLSLATIDTTINGGRLHLEPTIVRDDEGTSWLRLGPESSVRNARVNDEVSHRVLSFVAPVLESATRVHGQVSVALQEAMFPLNGPRADQAKVEGSVDFQDVEFVPGPLVDDLFGLVGAERRPTLRLSEPVSLTIADRKVQQSGFAIPIGRATRIELAGWVDFDRNLALTASLPLTPAMVGNNELLTNIIGGTRISVPIRGTLQKPQVDREAFRVGMRDLGKTLLERTAGQGAAELLMRLTRPRDPNAPPPPPRLTPEERRERRMEKRAERRRRRDGLAPPGGP